MSLSAQRKMKISLSQFARDTERDGLISGLVIWLMIITVFAFIATYIIFEPPRFTISEEEFLNKSEQQSRVVKDSHMPVEIRKYYVTRTDDGFYNSHYEISSDNDEQVNRFEIGITRYDSWRRRYVDYKSIETINPETKPGSFEMTWGYDLSKDREYTHIVYIKRVELKSGKIFHFEERPLDMLE